MTTRWALALLIILLGAAPALADRAYGTSDQLPPQDNYVTYGHP